jgi:N utilization substance protein B
MNAKPSERRKARRLLVQALYQWGMSGAQPQEIEVQFLAEQDVKGADLAYFQECLREIVSHRATLDDALKPCMHLSLDEVDPVELAVLRLACYEMRERLDIPYKVVINEALEQAKTFGATDGHKFVNGVLDKLARQLRATEIAAFKRS